MKRQDYRQILGRLPIENPTPVDMALVCPHLTQEQAVAAFGTESGCVACPSLRVRGAFHVVSFRAASTEGSESHPAMLTWSFASRTITSYVNTQGHSERFNSYPHIAEATKFAEEHWGDELILDSWMDVCQFSIQDPSDLNQGRFCKGRPKLVANVSVCLNRRLNDLINDHSKPASILFDEAIFEMTTDEMIWRELKGSRGTHAFGNCALCASGLGLTKCDGCGHEFKDNGMGGTSSTPLSRRMVKLLEEDGYVFKKNPQIAWNTEVEQYETFQRELANAE